MKFISFLESLETFKVPDRNDPSKEVEIKRYVLEPEKEPTVVIFGKFNPWTGPNGHGRLVDFAKKKGFKKIVIASPLKKEGDLFTREQKTEIIKKATNLEVLTVKSSIPLRMFTDLLNYNIERPVIFVGQDREKDFKKYFIPYNKNNKKVTDIEHEDFGKGEYIVSPRNETSATLVREALLNNDDKKFFELTGYDQDMLTTMKDMLRKNGHEI
jgi:phosphopantetheine adenylyltransferase